LMGYIVNDPIKKQIIIPDQRRFALTIAHIVPQNPNTSQPIIRTRKIYPIFFQYYIFIRVKDIVQFYCIMFV
jgi:hypothetical protein